MQRESPPPVAKTMAEDVTAHDIIIFSPEEVLKMAKYYHINIAEKQEFWLLEVAKQAIIAPLNPPWQEITDADGNPLFVNAR